MSAHCSLGFDPLEWLMLIAAVLLLSTVALVIYQHTSCAMKTISAGGSLLLLTILLAGCQTDSVSSLTPHGGYMTRVNDPARCPPAKVAKVNRAALGLTLLGEPQRMAVFQDRLRGLCEVATVKQLSADSWRASCAEDSSFIIKVYSDGFMTVTRSGHGKSAHSPDPPPTS